MGRPRFNFFVSSPSPYSLSFSDDLDAPGAELYKNKADYDAARIYVKSLFTSVQLAVKDKITHLPVAPQIIITGVQVSTKEDLRHQLSKEFSSDDLAETAMRRWLPDYVSEGEKKTHSGQSVSFNAILGASYRIETIHGQYYYFSGVLSPRSWPKTVKDVLLVERGAKIRQEEVKEGEGGAIVDPPK